MSTRSLIGKTLPDGNIRYIYCHNDGYPTYTGVVLRDNYMLDKQVDRLLDLGDLSSLGSEIGEQHDFNEPYGSDLYKQHETWCRAYGRDRGETEVEAKIVDTAAWKEIRKKSWAEWIYLYNPEQGWMCKPNLQRNLDNPYMTIEDAVAYYENEK